MRVPSLLFLVGAIAAIAISPVALMPTAMATKKATVPALSPASLQDAIAINGNSTWELDNQQSSLVCAVSHYGLSFIYGRFNTCSGTVEMNFQEPDQSKFNFSIDPDSIDTNDASRDIALRGESCLDARQFDSIKFESFEVDSEDKKFGDKTQRTFFVTGNLSLHGETRRVTIPIELLAIGNGPDKKIRCGFMSRFVVSRREFGLDALAGSIGDSVAVTFCFQAIREETDAEEKADNTENEFRFGGTDEPKATESRTQPNIEVETATKKNLEDYFEPRDQTAPDDDLFGE